MIEAKQFEVDGVTYELTQFGAKKGMAVLAKVTALVGPALGDAVLNDAKGTLDMGALVSGLTRALGEHDLYATCMEFAELCRFSVDGGSKFVPLAKPAATFDDHFAGRYVQLLEWVRGCFEANYSGFFDELRRRVGPQLSGSTTTATPSPAAK